MRAITAAIGIGLLLALGCQTPPPASNTSTPLPTVAPTAPPPSPTAVAAAKPAASPPAPPAASPAAGAQGAVSSSCDLAFYPVRPNARWQYRITGTVPTTFTETRTNSTASSFTTRMEFPDITVENEWRCLPDGLLASQINRLSTAQGQMRFDAVRSSGVTIPRDSAWTPGARWVNEFEVRAAQLPAVQGSAEGKVVVESSLAGEEAVTVPAGSYQAMRVNQNTRLELSLSMSGMTMPMTLSFNGTAWFARGVGMVKHEVSGEIGDGTTELISFSP